MTLAPLLLALALAGDPGLLERALGAAAGAPSGAVHLGAEGDSLRATTTGASVEAHLSLALDPLPIPTSAATTPPSPMPPPAPRAAPAPEPAPAPPADIPGLLSRTTPAEGEALLLLLGDDGTLVERHVGPAGVEERTVGHVSLIPPVDQRRDADGRILQTVQVGDAEVEVLRDPLGRFLSARAIPARTALR